MERFFLVCISPFGHMWSEEEDTKYNFMFQFYNISAAHLQSESFSHTTNTHRHTKAMHTYCPSGNNVYTMCTLFDVVQHFAKLFRFCRVAKCRAPPYEFRLVHHVLVYTGGKIKAPRTWTTTRCKYTFIMYLLQNHKRNEIWLHPMDQPFKSRYIV